ncbi:hypothetical protein MMC18_000131 [Xylographa bjoerkii]|nr:hypothetical protein [Xylographa bjoerkii]
MAIVRNRRHIKAPKNLTSNLLLLIITTISFQIIRLHNLTTTLKSNQQDPTKPAPTFTLTMSEYQCPAFPASGTHCLLDCKQYGWYGFRRCLEHHKHNLPCSEECLLRAAEDAECMDSNFAWQNALGVAFAANAAWAEAEDNAREILRKGGEGIREALVAVLGAYVRQKRAATDERRKEAIWHGKIEQRRVRRGQVVFNYKA